MSKFQALNSNEILDKIHLIEICFLEFSIFKLYIISIQIGIKVTFDADLSFLTKNQQKIA